VYYVDSETSVLDIDILLQHSMQLLYIPEEDADKYSQIKQANSNRLIWKQSSEGACTITVSW
jgi:hypothetical protein